MACDTPSPAFRGVEPVRVKVAQSVFDVRTSGKRAEAIRVNSEWAPRMGATAPRGVVAIEAASGCQVRRLRAEMDKGGRDHHQADGALAKVSRLCTVIGGTGHDSAKMY